MADRDYDRDRWQSEDTENRNRDWERNQGRSNYERGTSDRGYSGRGYSRSTDIGRGYPRGSGYTRGGYGSDWERGSFPLDYNRRADQGWANDFDWDEEPVWSYSEYWWIVPGPYTGVGPKGYERSDERLCDEVCERMAQHGHLDASNIHVDIEKGEATLTGIVNTRREKRLAEDITESVFGVKDVHNQLRIKDQERFGTSGQERSRPFEAGRQQNQASQNLGQSTPGLGASGERTGGWEYPGQDYGNRAHGSQETGRQGMSSNEMGQRLNAQAPEDYRSQDMGNQTAGNRNPGDRNFGEQDYGYRSTSSQGTGQSGSQDVRAQEMGSPTGSTETGSTSGMSSNLNPGVYTYTAGPTRAESRTGQQSSPGTGSQTTRAQIRSADEVGSMDMSSSYRSGQTPPDVDRGDVHSSEGPEIHIDESHMATTLPSGNLRSRIHEDMEVYDRQGDPIGRVKEVRQNDFLVDRPMARDVYVPFSACQSLENEITLNIRASEVDQQNWELSDLFGSQ